MKVKLLSYTQEPEKVVAMAGRLCYSSIDIGELESNLTDEKIKSFITKLKSMGHLSPFEHASFTFAIEDISRACSHQLVRHRTGKFSQQSQRYVKNKDSKYVIPPSVQNNASYAKYLHYLDKAQEHYEELAKELQIEDARYILPNASCTKIIVTMDARNLLHFFEQRCCKRAQWEIRQLANEMLKLVKEVAPNIFEGAGAPCNKCPEGEMSCKKEKK